MLADSWSTITGRERPDLWQSFRSLAIREGQVVTDFSIIQNHGQRFTPEDLVWNTHAR